MQVEEAEYTRLCSSKKILTVNGSFPGPTLYAHRGDTIIVRVFNNGNQNITLHWHGVKQPRNPWSDGPEFITQCPIQPGRNFTQTLLLSDEEGTIWWHAHSDWSRATVHGAIIVYPANGTDHYPYAKPDVEVPIILDTFRLTVERGKTYLLRMVNAVMNNIMFFSIANHQLTVVGTDGSYTKPFKADYAVISPGQTLDLLLQPNQTSDHYYMAARALNTATRVKYDSTVATGILQYSGNYTPSSAPFFPVLPDHTNDASSINFTRRLRSLDDSDHPIDVPLNVTTHLYFTVSINTRPCNTSSPCAGPNGTMFAASVNNNSFILPGVDILEAYSGRYSAAGVYSDDFPRVPPLAFNFTGDNLPLNLQVPERNTTAKVVVLEYGSTVELVFQGTNLVAGIDHPMHLHGFSFYVVGSDMGNFDKDKDPLTKYNLVDPPLMNTIAVPRNAWTAIRFKADNPGVWFMHCHLERHTSWGMEMSFIVKDGKRPDQKMLPPPPDMPLC
ncbi:unnamed protein product [Cuscuta campestris]|uniref:Laccase n=1 Tax=Cuscuta campestris TaxID=132261 RepID=A0A484NIS8_9ASTE|nr:unnamed protein product [Cuscuta campestris]